jgi:myo-inositol-1(or 4)-monophosphatase
VSRLSLPADSELTPLALEAIAIEAVTRAGDLIRSQLGAAVAVGLKSSPTDVVTQTDVDSEALIRDLLLAVTPQAGIIGEEGGETTSATSSLQWIIDPLDGTVNFTYGIPLFAVSVAAARGGVIVAGAVIDVLPGEVFSAALGLGARRNGDAIAVSTCSELRNALIMTGFSYRADLRRTQGNIVRDLLPIVRDIRCFGSAAIEMCWVACGRVDGYYERDTKLWDYAAGALIAAEAGAEVELPCPENEGLTAVAPQGLFALLRGLVEQPAAP